MGVSKSRNTPKLSILIGFSIINHPFWWVSPYFWKHPYTLKNICLFLEGLLVRVFFGFEDEMFSVWRFLNPL